MMHFKPAIGYVAGEGGTDGRAASAVEESILAFCAAKRAADESLRHVQESPPPHVAANRTFTMLYEAHLRDREALFEAMRRLEEACGAQGQRDTPAANP